MRSSQSIEPKIAKKLYFFDRIEAEKSSEPPLGVTLRVTFVLGTFWWTSGADPFFLKSEDPTLNLKIKLTY